MTATWKVAPCLAFGNTAVLKMSELSPLTAARLGELALEAGIPAGRAQRRARLRPDAGEPLCQHPDVRAISFTGSTLTGNRIVKGAGLKKFSMELGGKSPFVVFEDADLRARARRRALHDLLEQRRALHRRLAHPGAEVHLRRFRGALQPSARDASAWATRSTKRRIIGPMISQAHLAKVRSYIADGSKEGATLLCGGLERPSYAAELPPAVRSGNFVWPTVFADVDNRMRIAQEEIFGPVACLIPFDDEADAIAKANDIALRAVSSYVWSENLGRAHRVAAAIEAGMCFVNSQNVRDLRQPFGGTKASRYRARGRHLELRGVPRAEERLREPRFPSHSALGRLSGCSTTRHTRHEPLSAAEVPVRPQSRPERAANVPR